MGAAKRGQPPTTLFVRRSICFKIVQYVRRYNLTPRQAWLKLSEYDLKKNKFTERGFEELINEHYKNKTKKEHWVNEFKNKKNRIQFYKNHIKKKWLDEYLTFKEKQVEEDLERSRWILKILRKSAR